MTYALQIWRNISVDTEPAAPQFDVQIIPVSQSRIVAKSVPPPQKISLCDRAYGKPSHNPPPKTQTLTANVYKLKSPLGPRSQETDPFAELRKQRASPDSGTPDVDPLAEVKKFCRSQSELMDLKHQVRAVTRQIEKLSPELPQLAADGQIHILFTKMMTQLQEFNREIREIPVAKLRAKAKDSAPQFETIIDAKYKAIMKTVDLLNRQIKAAKKPAGK